MRISKRANRTLEEHHPETRVRHIEIRFGKIANLRIAYIVADVGHAGFIAFPVCDLHKRVGAVDTHDFTAWPHHLPDFESCLSKPAADVEHFVALPNAEIGVRDVAVYLPIA